MLASFLLDRLLANGFRRYSGVPCSILKPLINCVIDSPAADFLPATVEGEAAAYAAGTWLAGEPAVVMLQNSGLGNIVNPYTSLLATYRIPALFLVTWRGEPGGSDAAQHRIMGELTLPLLETLGISRVVLEDSEAGLADAVSRAEESVRRQERSFAIVLRRGLFEPRKLEAIERLSRETSTECATLGDEADLPARWDAVQVISEHTAGHPVISSTGYNSREFFNAGDRPSNFYMQGSMGFALPIALGVAACRPGPVFCVDGDGSVLMRVGGLATAGAKCRGNLTYILLDNGVHDSTGAQATVSGNVRFDRLADAMGFDLFFRVNNVNELPAAIERCSREDGTGFIHVPIAAGTAEAMKRPDTSPAEIARRFAKFLGGEA